MFPLEHAPTRRSDFPERDDNIAQDNLCNDRTVLIYVSLITVNNFTRITVQHFVRQETRHRWGAALAAKVSSSNGIKQLLKSSKSK